MFWFVVLQLHVAKLFFVPDCAYALGVLDGVLLYLMLKINIAWTSMRPRTRTWMVRS